MDLEKVLQAGDRCIHEEPPACSAVCPLHMDVKAFVTEVEKNDFKKAYKILEKKLPFPRIIGRICDHPCEGACIRKNIDGSVKISELEIAAVVYGYTPEKKGLIIPPNNKRVAVVGGGLSGLTVAVDLQKKGFEVTIYEKSGKLGGQIWNYAQTKIPVEIIEQELNQIEKKKIAIFYDTLIDEQGMQKLMQEFDGIYLGTGEWEQSLEIDPITFQVGKSPVFAGGKLATQRDSIVFSASSGRRAAISMERYIKGVSMVASREREGSFTTPLKVRTDEVPVKAAIQKSGEMYCEEEALEEAERCLKCQCTKCIEGCVHLQQFKISPKQYTRNINHNERIILGTHHANKMINSCTLCGLCTVMCEDGVDMKEIIQETRESMVERGKMPASVHDFALKDMKFSNSDRFFMIKSPPPIPKEKQRERERELFMYPRISFSKYAQSMYKKVEPEKAQVDYLFYPGCQLSASHPEYVEKSYHYLLASIKEGVGIMLGCCGAPADWAGRQDLIKENIVKIKDIWIEKGRPTFILACSSCERVFKEYLHEINTVSLWEIFERFGLPQDANRLEGRVFNIHDACSTRNNSNIHNSVRKIATLLGSSIEEMKYTRETTKCCGYGGLVYYANPSHSKDFVRDRIGESQEDLLVYCAMCKDLFVDSGKRSFHLLDLIFAKNMESTGLQKMPNLSQRQKNRMGLKSKLLKELWGEESIVNREDESKLIIPEKVWGFMEKSYILQEDVQRVVENSQATGERFYNSKEDDYLARLRVDDVSFWVRYKEVPQGIVIQSVYSHRMEIVEE